MLKFDSQPTLTGKLLRLRPLTPTDFENLYSVAADPLIWEQHPEKTRYQREVFERFFEGALASKGALVAIDTATGRIIGSSRYDKFDREKSQVEIGYTFLSRACWGNGYNSEMKSLMIGHAFQFVNEILFYIGEHNLRSRKAVEKLGARLIGGVERRHNSAPAHSAVVYGLIKK